MSKFILFFSLVFCLLVYTSNTFADEPASGEIVTNSQCNAQSAQRLRALARGAAYVRHCVDGALAAVEAGITNIEDLFTQEMLSNGSCAAALIGLDQSVTAARNAGLFNAVTLRKVNAARRLARQRSLLHRRVPVNLRQQIRRWEDAASRGGAQIPRREAIQQVAARNTPRRWAYTAAGVFTVRGAAVTSGVIMAANQGVMTFGYDRTAHSCTDPEIPLIQNENGSCGLNFSRMDQVVSFLSNDGLMNARIARDPQICDQLQDWFSALYQELIFAFPETNIGDVTMDNQIACFDGDYRYNLNVGDPDGGEGASYTINHRPGTQETRISQTGSTLFTEIVVTRNGDGEISQLVVTSPGREEPTTYTGAEIQQATGDDVGLIYAVARGLGNLDANFYGAAAQHCCNNSAAHCSTLGVTASSPSRGAGDDSPTSTPEDTDI